MPLGNRGVRTIGMFTLRRLALFLVVLTAMLQGSWGYAQASLNPLVGVKVLPLPSSRVRVIFQFEQPITEKPSGFMIENPVKLVFDFPHAKESLPQAFLNKKVDAGVLQRYTIISSSSRVRAVLNLNELVVYHTDVSGRQFNVILAPKASPSSFKQQASVYQTHTTKTRYLLEDIDFRGAGKNGGKLVIKLSNATVDVDIKQLEERVMIKFSDTRIPAKLRRRLDVKDFHTPVTMIDAYQRGQNAQLELKTQGGYGHFAYQVNKEFFVEVYPLTPEEIKQAKLKKEVYTGKRISLNFQNISVRAVLQLIAEFTGNNVVVSDKVGGNITLRLHSVPWDQALSIIMKTKGLAKRQMGNVLLIAPAQEISAREKEELESIQQSKALAPLLSDLMQINYAKAGDIAALLDNKSNKMLTSRGTLSVDARTNSIWIQDTAAKLAEIKALVKKLDVPVRQVLIEARVVIVNKDFEHDIGVRFGTTHSDYMSGSLEGANELRQGTAPADVTLANRLNLDLAAPTSSGAPATIGLALARISKGLLLDLELSALEIEGKGEVISSPRLITANQQEAVIEAGEEIPYQEATSSGAASIAFKKAVLRLKVTPQITPDNKIILDLAVNQDTPSANLFNGVPAILTKQIETNVLVSNGQTIVLGGIYRQDKRQAIRRVPFLGEMPIIGNLFRNKQKILKREELLIFITPKIIKHSFMTS